MILFFDSKIWNRYYNTWTEQLACCFASFHSLVDEGWDRYYILKDMTTFKIIIYYDKIFPFIEIFPQGTRRAQSRKGRWSSWNTWAIFLLREFTVSWKDIIFGMEWNFVLLNIQLTWCWGKENFTFDSCYLWLTIKQPWPSMFILKFEQSRFHKGWVFNTTNYKFALIRFHPSSHTIRNGFWIYNLARRRSSI